MSKEKELAINTIILTIGKLCTQFISFLLLPLYTALLSPSEYGIFDLLNTYVTLLVPLFSLQFENGLFRFMLECRNSMMKQTQIITTVIITNIRQTFLYLAFFCIISIFWKSEYRFFLAINVILSIYLNTFLQVPRGLGNNFSYAVGSFISAGLTVLLNVIFVAVLHSGVWGMFYATLISQFITIIYLFINQKMWRFIKFNQYKKQLFKEIFNYSFPLVPNQLAWWILGVSDRTVLSFYIGTAANGVYSVANKFSSVYATFYNIFNMAWTESVSIHINEVDSNVFLTKVINMMFKIFSSLCFGIISVLPFVFSMFVDKNYSEAYYHIPILMIAVLFQIVVGLYSVIYIALKKSKEVAKTSMIAAVINFSINLGLIKFIGIYAASISTLIAFMIMAIYRYHHVKQFINIKINSKILLTTIITGSIVLSSFYYDCQILNIISLIYVSIYTLTMNLLYL